MNAETIYNNKAFIYAQIKSVPKYFWGQMSSDEIKSDLALAICKCTKNFKSNKNSNIASYIRKTFIGNLQNSLREKLFYKESEAPLEAAFNHTYTDKVMEDEELMAYLSSLPQELLEDLTQFALGKKNKEEIVANPSFKRMNINRILDKLDCLV